MKKEYVIGVIALILLVWIIFGQESTLSQTVNQKDVTGKEGIPLVLLFFAGLALFAFAMGMHVWPHAPRGKR